MCFSCHIRHLTKCPNWCRTWNICFHLIFSWKMLKPNFAFWDILMLLRCLNSKEIKLQSSIRVICIIFDLIFFSWKLKIKQIFQVRQQFQCFFKRRIWHEEHIRHKNYICWILSACISNQCRSQIHAWILLKKNFYCINIYSIFCRASPFHREWLPLINILMIETFSQKANQNLSRLWPIEAIRSEKDLTCRK